MSTPVYDYYTMATVLYITEDMPNDLTLITVKSNSQILLTKVIGVENIQNCK